MNEKIKLAITLFENIMYSARNQKSMRSKEFQTQLVYSAKNKRKDKLAKNIMVEVLRSRNYNGV